MDYQRGEDFEQYVEELSTLSIPSEKSFNITIVTYPPSMKGDRFNKKTIPHDRFILTNYRLFFSGPSFGDYFNSKKELSTNGQNLTVDSLANMGIYQYACSLISFFQDKVIDRILKIKQAESYIFGEMKSNMFSFVNRR